MNCAFCSDGVKNRKIDEGRFSYVLLSSPRLAVGHTLIIPKRHVQIFSDLTEDEGAEIFKFLRKYQDKVLEKLASATEIRQNYKPHLEDSRTHVNHFHFHIVPREENDDIAKKVDVHRKQFYIDMSDEEFQKISKLLTE